MEAAILAIGTEITRGELCDTNTAWLSAQLTDVGVDVVEHCSVDDDDTRIAATLLRLGKVHDLLLVTGGLGPTSDDRTSACAAAALGVSQFRDAESLSAIEARYAAAGRTMAESNRKQADFPQGATPLPNDVGTAPGFRLTLGRAEAFFMPGVPREMQHLFARHVAAFVQSRVRRRSHQIHLRTFGLAESVLAERVADLDQGGALADERVTLGYRASFPDVELKVLARAEDLRVAEELAEKYAALARERLEPFVYGGRDTDFPSSVGQRFKERGLRVATAESCTGGLIGKLLTDLPGSSTYYVGSVVAYHNTAKHALLGVPEDVLAREGAVSGPVVEAMARGAVQRFDVDAAVSVSGIAGPDGGSASKPVGTVWFGLANRTGKTLAVQCRFPWDRDRVRIYTAHYALLLLRDFACGELDSVDGAGPTLSVAGFRVLPAGQKAPAGATP